MRILFLLYFTFLGTEVGMLLKSVLKMQKLYYKLISQDSREHSATTREVVEKVGSQMERKVMFWGIAAVLIQPILNLLGKAFPLSRFSKKKESPSSAENDNSGVEVPPK